MGELVAVRQDEGNCDKDFRIQHPKITPSKSSTNLVTRKHLSDASINEIS